MDLSTTMPRIKPINPEPLGRRILCALRLATPRWEQTVMAEWEASGNKVNALRCIRTLTGCSLQSAMQHFERITGEKFPKWGAR